MEANLSLSTRRFLQFPKASLQLSLTKPLSFFCLQKALFVRQNAPKHLLFQQVGWLCEQYSPSSSRLPLVIHIS